MAIKKKTQPDQNPNAARFAQALAFHRNGHLPQACQFYEAILSKQADHIDALHMLGVAHMQLGQHASGVELIERALNFGGPDSFMLSNLGNGLNKLGKHREAISVFTQALEMNPKAPETLNNLGIALAADGNHRQALARFDEAILLRPVFPECHNNRASSLRALGHADEAIRSCEQALRQRPRYAEACNNLGLSLRTAGREDEALQQFNAAIALQPDFLKALSNRASVYRQRHEYALALADSLRVLTLAPNLFEVHNNAGLALLALGRTEDALARFDAALSLAPQNPAVLNNRGNALHALGKTDEAAISFETALEHAPDHADTLNNFAHLLLATGQVARALALAERVTQIAPEMPEGYNNLGLALSAGGDPERARDAFNEALRLRPRDSSALNNRGHVIELLGLYEEALTDFSTALDCQPDAINARWNRALSALRLGRFVEGWSDYEARWDLPGQHLPDLPMPRWQGEPLAGRSILIWAEQGLGDTLQFCRYIPLLAARGARVFLQVPATLEPLLRSLAGITAIFNQDNDLPVTDFHCPILSLPGVFGTHADTIPAALPYLGADPAKLAHWQARLPLSTARRIGLVCAGNARFANDSQRSLALQMFLPLMQADVQWYLLQPACSAEDAECLHRHPQIVDLRGQLQDFSDTAAIVAQMDLIISVDTSVAHLAGAMQRPLWLLLPCSADWRWQIGRQDSPWYPGARLFRQARRGDWGSVINALQGALAEPLAPQSGT